jgi:hypothetical protein
MYWTGRVATAVLGHISAMPESQESIPLSLLLTLMDFFWHPWRGRPGLMIRPQTPSQQFNRFLALAIVNFQHSPKHLKYARHHQKLP